MVKVVILYTYCTAHTCKKLQGHSPGGVVVEVEVAEKMEATQYKNTKIETQTSVIYVSVPNCTVSYK